VKHIIGANLSSNVPSSQTLTVDEDSAGQRLDNFLMRHLKGVPKTHVYRIIRSGEVRINKGRVSADTRIAAGDLVRLPPMRVSERADEKAEAMAALAAKASKQASSGQGGSAATSAGGFVPAKDFPILFEDDYFLAIHKPAGVAVHGGSGVSFGVIEQLRMARPRAPYLELVHRLDRETSGILLVAKKRSALKNLQDQFRERETGKIYLAMVQGLWPERLKVLNKPLHKYVLPGKDGQADGGERRVKVVAKDDPDGMPSLTMVNLRGTTAADAAQAYSLLEVTLKTGRTHQIRVHLASEGMPIVGDDKYGNFDLNKELAKVAGPGGLKRMFLHAWRFQCNHPGTGKRVELQAELPPELAAFLRHAMPPSAD
jgi:23S rRNA pseudouridine955/2504/2580 synthase